MIKFLTSSLLCLFISCSQKGGDQISKDCSQIKIETQREYDLSNYAAAIKWYIDYENCVIKKYEYYMKLAFLYQKNGQTKLSKVQLQTVLKLIDQEAELDLYDNSILKANAYLILSDMKNASKELIGIDRDKLTKVQMKQVEDIELFTNQKWESRTGFSCCK